MEESILNAEAEVARLEQKLTDPALSVDHVRAGEAYRAVAAAQQRVAELYERWAELEAIIG